MNKTQFVTGVTLATLAGFPTMAQSPSAYSWTNLPKIAQPVFRKDTLSILSYGAKPDGLTLNTKSTNAAIAACSQKGGGAVLVPSGLWITPLGSHVTLHNIIYLYCAIRY